MDTDNIEQIQTQAERLLNHLRDNTVNCPIRYSYIQGVPLDDLMYTDKYPNDERLWDSCEESLGTCVKKLGIPKSVIKEVVKYLQRNKDEPKIRMMEEGLWWMVWRNVE